MKFVVSIVAFFHAFLCFSQGDYLEIIDLIDGAPVVAEKYTGLKKHYVVNDKKGKGKTIEFKKGNQEWSRVSLHGKWGFVYFDESEKTTNTYRIIDNKVFELIDGSVGHSAIYEKSESVNLIYLFLWRDLYVVEYQNQLIPVQRRNKLMTAFDDPCIVKKLSELTYNSKHRLIRKNKKTGKSDLLTLLAQCNGLNH